MNSISPLVTVVLPTYNGAGFLRESVDSIIGQSYQNWELIIVDDASIDETFRIATDFSMLDSRIVVFRNEVNRKLPGSLNVGFSRARGELLTWTSDDNRYRPHALERLVEFLQTHPDYDMVYSSFSLMNERGEVLDRKDLEGPSHLWRANVIGGSFLYTRKMAERTGTYDENRFVVEDYEYWLRASQHSRIGQLKEDLYLYREHAGSLTTRFSRRRAKLTEDVQIRYLPHLPYVDKDTLRKAYQRLVRRALLRGQLPAGVRRFSIFFKAFPVYSLKWLGWFFRTAAEDRIIRIFKKDHRSRVFGIDETAVGGEKQ